MILIDRTGEGRHNNDATGLAVHLAQNPFLGAQAVNAGVGHQSLLAFRIDRPFAFHTAQVQTHLVNHMSSPSL